MESLSYTKGVPQTRAAIECSSDDDCGTGEKFCHDSKCVCGKTTPILDQDRCLSHSELGNACYVTEQCLGNSKCVEGICSCGSDEITLKNPSNLISYCHPKRRLNEECISDFQCPVNSYCSSGKFGCICLDGYSEATVNQSGTLTQQCLAKRCQDLGNCESEFYECREYLCKCLPTHLDIVSGKCYKLGATGGKLSENYSLGTNGNMTKADDGKDSFYSIWKDFIDDDSDKMWLVSIILIAASILIIFLIFMLIRRHYLGYCWRAHKKEYEPNNKGKPNYFNKNSINQKSFRQKADDSGNDTDDQGPENRANLVSRKDVYNNNVLKLDRDANDEGTDGDAPFINDSHRAGDHRRGYVKVNISDSRNRQNSSSEYSQNNHQQRPLPNSTSTPV